MTQQKEKRNKTQKESVSQRVLQMKTEYLEPE